jgi:hypothetical protein
VVRAWNTTYSGYSSAQFQWWVYASNYWTASATISYWILSGLGGASPQMKFEFNTGNLGINYNSEANASVPTGLSVSTASRDLEQSISRTGLKAIAEFYASSSYVSGSETADRTRFCIGNSNPNVNGSRSTTILLWGYDNDEIYGGTTAIAHTEFGSDYWQNGSKTFFLWDSQGGQRMMYIDYLNNILCWGAGAGANAAYDSTLGGSIFI